MAIKTPIAVMAGALLMAGCVSSPKTPIPNDVEKHYNKIAKVYDPEHVDQKLSTADQYIRAGMDIIDADCNSFFRRLSEYNRRASATQNGVNLLGGTTAGVMAATEANAKSIALAALGFAGIEAQLKNYRDYELLAPYAESSSKLIDKARVSYRGQPWPTNQIDAVTFVRGYAKLCTYDTIQQYINAAVQQANTGLGNAPAAGGIPADQRKIVETALPTAGLETLTDTQWARLYWFLTTGLAGDEPRNQFAEEFPNLATSLTQPGKTSALNELGKQVVSQLGALAIRDATFKAMLKANEDARVKAQVEADAAAKKEAGEAITTSKALLSAQASALTRDAITGGAETRPPGNKDPVELAAELGAKVAAARAKPVRLPPTTAPVAPWSGPAPVMVTK